MKQNKETLKKHFETGDKPTQGQYSDLIDSYVDSKQPEGEANRRFVIDETGEVSVATGEKAPEYNLQQVSDNDNVTSNNIILKKAEANSIQSIVFETASQDYKIEQETISDPKGGKTTLRVKNDENTLLEIEPNKISSFTSLRAETESNQLALKNTLSDKVVQINVPNGLTGSCILQTPDKSGTIALLSDVSLNDLKDGMRFDGAGTLNGDENDKYAISVIPKKSVFSYLGAAINNEPILLFPRVTYGLSDIIVEATISVQNEIPINIQTSFRVSGNADLNNLATNFLQGTMSTSGIKDMKVEVGVFERRGDKFLSIKYKSNEIAENDFNTQKVVTINKIIVRPFSPLTDNHNEELYENTDLDLLVNGVFTVQNTVKGNDLLPVSKPNGVQTIVAGTNITIDKTDPQRPIINATAASEGSSTNLSYNASTRTLTSSSGTDAVLPLANKTNAGLMKANFYEEGTFMPTLVDQGGGATYSSISTKANYIKIGNSVYFEIEFNTINTTGIPTGTVRIESLPFIIRPAAGKCVFNVSAQGGNLNFTTINGVSGGSGAINLLMGTGGDLNRKGYNNITFTNGVLLISGTYITNVYTP